VCINYNKINKGVTMDTFKQFINEREEKRLVYGTKTGKWYSVGKDDRDFIHGITPEEFKKLGAEKAKKKYLNQ
jgi:hypothetical protein